MHEFERLIFELRRSRAMPDRWLDTVETRGGALVRWFRRMQRRDPLRDAVKRLPRWSAVRRAVEARAETGDDVCAQAMVDSLLTDRVSAWRERAAAARVAGALATSPKCRTVVDELLCQVARGESIFDRNPIRRAAAISVGWGAFILVAGAGAALATFRVILWTDAADLVRALWALALPVWAGLALVFYPMDYWGKLNEANGRMAKLRAAAAEGLAIHPDPRNLAALASAAATDKPEVRKAALAALDAVVPLVTEAHYGEYSPDVVRDLCRVLGRGPEARDLALIAALTRAGTGRSVDAMDRQARFGKTPAIRQAALAALPVLLGRREKERLSEQLVRPAVAPFGPADLLVRPAPAGASGDTSTLVRPAMPEEAAALQQTVGGGG
jgi:hypothetical protein